MIAVSDAWKEAHKQMLLPESFVEISMDVVDTDVSASVSGWIYPESNYSEVVNADKRIGNEPYAWLEHNLWFLDGSKGIAPDKESTGTNTRLIMDSSYSKIDIRLDSPGKQIPGITITWSSQYDEYATDFTVSVWKKTSNAGFVGIGEIHVTDNTDVISFVDMSISEYDRIDIEVHEWSLPDHRSRIDSVKFGQMLVFDKNQIISYTHEMSGNPLGTELSRNAIEFEVDNSDGRWNMLNPNGLAKYLYERQKLVVHYGLQLDTGIEWIQAGVFYLSEWKAPANGMTATFIARDAIEFMLNTTYTRSVCRAKVTDGQYAHVYNLRENIYTLIDGTWYMGLDENETKLLAPGTALDIYEIVWVDYCDGFWAARTDWGWADMSGFSISNTLNADVASAIETGFPKDVPIRYHTKFNSVPAPCFIEKVGVAEFLQCCGSIVGFTMWQSADGVLKLDYPDYVNDDYRISKSVSYSHPDVELLKPLRQIKFVEHNEYNGEEGNTESFSVNSTGEDITIDCPYATDLIYLQDWKALSKVYAGWWKYREMISGEFRADPRLELFDIVTVETKYGDYTHVMLTNVKYTYNGSFRCNYTGKVVDARMDEIVEELVEEIVEEEIVEEVAEGE